MDGRFRYRAEDRRRRIKTYAPTILWEHNGGTAVYYILLLLLLLQWYYPAGRRYVNLNSISLAQHTHDTQQCYYYTTIVRTEPRVASMCESGVPRSSVYGTSVVVGPGGAASVVRMRIADVRWRRDRFSRLYHYHHVGHPPLPANTNAPTNNTITTILLILPLYVVPQNIIVYIYYTLFYSMVWQAPVRSPRARV